MRPAAGDGEQRLTIATTNVCVGTARTQGGVHIRSRRDPLLTQHGSERSEETGATHGLLPYVVLACPIGAGSLDDGVTDLTAE